MNMRFERKYVIDHLSVEEIFQLIRLHPASFRMAYPPRKVNNIYFDSPDFEAYQDNLRGIGIRKKTRLRWYGSQSFADNPIQLEEKIKNGLLGYKNTHHLPDNANIKTLSDLSLPTFFTEQHLAPALFNYYHRHYFLSADRRFRMTVDTNQAFGIPRLTPSQNAPYHLPDQIILELKFDQKDAPKQDQVTQHLPFRLNKHSKYVTGIEFITN